jgi:ribosomal protein L40E
MAGGAIEVVVIVVLLWVFLFAWVAFMAVRGVFRGIGRLIGFTAQRAPLRASVCSRLRCGADNPPQARFCRRCGLPLIRAGRQRAAA